MWTENLFCILLFALCLENVMTSSITPTPILNSRKVATKSQNTSISVSKTIPLSPSPSISATKVASHSTKMSASNTVETSSLSLEIYSPSKTLDGKTAAPTISPSKSTPIPQPSSSAKPATKVSLQKCSKSENDCKNDGECYSGRFKFCVCRGNFYGTKCEKEANALFRPLVYALGGTTGFLLLIICISLICMCRSSNRYKTSKEIDDFNSIGMRAKGTVNGSYGD